MWMWWLLGAWGGCEVPVEPAAPEAPIWEIAGLKLGESDAAAVEAWGDARGCRREGDEDRLRLVCDTEAVREGANPAPGRRIIVAYGEAARGYTAITTWDERAAAEQDYAGTISRITEVVGAVDRPGGALPARTSPVLDRVSARWQRDALSVQVGLLRVGEEHYVVSERWDLAEAPSISLGGGATAPKPATGEKSG